MIEAKIKITGQVTRIPPIRELYVVPRLAFGIFYLRTKFCDSRFSRSWDMIMRVETENVARDPDHAHSRGGLSSEGYD